MSSIPEELIDDILSQLRVKPLLRFQCVSKSWNALIRRPDFIKKHLDRSIQTNKERTLIVKERDSDYLLNYFSVRLHDDGRFGRVVKIHPPLHDPDRFAQISGCCNGLVFIHDLDAEIVIWNPSIKKYKKLPYEPSRPPSGFYKYSLPHLAFGHDPVNDDYKVLRVEEFLKLNPLSRAFEVNIYSLRAHSWRRVEDEWPYQESYISRCEMALSSKSLNGALHWLVTPLTEGARLSRCEMALSSKSLNGALHWLVTPLTEGARLSPTIVAFDLANEKFRVFPQPVPLESLDRNVNMALEVLGGRMLLCVCVCENASVGFNDVWVMKEYGVASSWTWLYTIVGDELPWYFSYYKPLVISKDGNKVLMEQDREYLFWYDIRKKSGRRFNIRDMLRNKSGRRDGFPSWFQTATCVGSLVLLHGFNASSPLV
ncbi:F-box protein CPR1-like [Corylus avellana]|uniref:F-box protein CPR1-like n=1 Tax=Corylus avellana TaxID=13451 RepID=UPI00286B7616|nr:F-box protein CPR1-like [Corylus avellana]